MLSLAEKLMLLALHDEKGSVVFSASSALQYGLAGALILELFFQNKITLTEKNIRVIDATPAGDSLLDQVLELISSSKKQKDPKHWIYKIDRKVKGIKNKITDALVQKEILRREERRLLWVIHYNRYPTRNISPEQEIRQRIQNIVLMNHPPDETDRALISLLKACSLVNEVFSKGQRKQAKKRIKEIAEDEKVGKAVSDIVAEITVAVTTGVIAATSASAATSS